VKFLLDENFPLALYHRLRTAGEDVDHVIALGQRGLSDQVLLQRIEKEAVIFLTQDIEFLEVKSIRTATILVSRVPQNLPIAARVDLWFDALERFTINRPAGTIFELLANGEIVPWKPARDG